MKKREIDLWSSDGVRRFERPSRCQRSGRGRGDSEFDPVGLFCDEQGFTTIAVAISLLLTLALVFSAAQIYQLNSLSSEVQSVADAAALAALDEVAEFMIVVRVCDAIILSLTLTSAVTSCLGVVASCVPAAQAVGKALTSAGKEMDAACEKFAEAVATGLNELQRALPYLAAANAAAVAAANNGDDSSYVALAVLSPSEGEEISVGGETGLSDAQDAADAESEEIAQAAQDAEDAAEAVQEAKEEAYEHDCGLYPSYCMAERAEVLASLSAADNPLYTSVDAWTFSVALERAQAYYTARLAAEEPEDDSVEEQAKSALRTNFYSYAVMLLSQGYVNEVGDTFSAYFPTLPSNTEEMRETILYTMDSYPVSVNEDGDYVMHAWDGCPGIEGETTMGSIQDMEMGLATGAFATCEICGFTAASMGKVAAASTSIENGFEYHYEQVAEAAVEYAQAQSALEEETASTKDTVSELLEGLLDALGVASSMRIDAAPPGSYGAIVIVANVGESAPSSGFESSFVQATGNLGTRVAVSAATLVEDPAGEGESIVTSLLDGFSDGGGLLSGVGDAVLSCWSTLLTVYADGQEALVDAVEDVLDSIPLLSATGLGTWAAETLEELIEQLGLEPANLNALKPVLVNTAHVAELDDGSFAAELLELKTLAIDNASALDGGIDSLLGIAGDALGDAFVDATDSIEIATLELYEDGPSVTIEFALPSAIQDAATNLIDEAVASLGDIVSELTGVTIWE